MIDADIRAHIELIRSLSKPGCALSIKALTATINNTKWFEPDGKAKGIRASLHARLVHDQLSGADVSRKAILLAGPLGAGKSTVVRKLLDETPECYLTIDADIFKIELLKEAITDGSYESFIKPAEVKKLEVVGHRFSQWNWRP